MSSRFQYSLKSYNSFSLDVYARDFVAFDSPEALRDALGVSPRLILGGGSNILFLTDFDGMILRNEIGGITRVDEDNDHVYVRAGAGVGWQALVEFTVAAGLGGLENLSLIPGTVGASPIQNIGAYGVEVKDSFYKLEAMEIATGKLKTFRAEDCAFGYRDSVFKRSLKAQFVILFVTFRLAKNPVLNMSYGALGAELAGISSPRVRDVSDAVIRIRRSKLPDPAEIGNAGSFFKNPEVDVVLFDQLRGRYPGIPAYPSPHGVKLAAGWLIEQCGWKGFRRGDAGCHARQALVLVNYGKASGQEIFDLSAEIRESVLEKFGVELEREVNVV